jgi:hypothetical protein
LLKRRKRFNERANEKRANLPLSVEPKTLSEDGSKPGKNPMTPALVPAKQ